MNIIEREARAGFPRMRGTQLQATIPVSQELLDRLLAPISLKIDLHESNKIDVTYRGIRTAAELIGITPDLTVVLSASWLARSAVRGALGWKPGLALYIVQRDKHIFILCSNIPAVARYRYYWQHLANVQVRTRPGLLLLQADAHIR